MIPPSLKLWRAKGGDNYMAEKSSSLNENQVISSLEDFYKKAPHLPANIREVLVKIVPWIAVIFGVLTVLGGLALVGVSPVAMFGGVGNSVFALVSGVIAIVSGVLMVIAFPKLQKHQYAGWRLLFWVEVLNIVSSLLALSVSAVIGAIIGALIGFYLLFEIRSYYK